MKELSIKEKAKAYDRVSKEVKDFFEGKQKMYNDVEQTLEYLFPNLKESKEEKTERILHSISSKMSLHLRDIFTEEEFQCFDTWSNVWLEKKGGQGNNEDEAILHRFSFYSYKDEPNILYLAGLYVNDEYRNKGIGTKILKIADEVAVSMKCSSILLKTEIGSNAERLYKNNGYSVFRREENQVWLEKQGQTFTKKDVDDAYLKGICDAKHELEKQGEHSIYNVPSREVILAIWDLGNEWKELTNGSISTEYGTQLDYIQKHWHESEYYLREKQGEQKHDNKVKPKFKVGDKVIGIVSDMQYYITDVCYDHYYTESGCIIMFCSQDNFKLVEQIKERYTWRPSDEQMNDLKKAIDSFTFETDYLQELFEDLKKLKGE